MPVAKVTKLQPVQMFWSLDEFHRRPPRQCGYSHLLQTWKEWNIYKRYVLEGANEFMVEAYYSNTWKRKVPFASASQRAIAACALLEWTERANGTMPTSRALYVLLPASELWMYGCSANALDAISFPLHIQHKRAEKETFWGTSFTPITTVMAVVPGPFGWVH